MSDEFYLRHKDRYGVVKRAAIADYLWLQYRNGVNEPGRLNFGLNVDTYDVTTFEPYDQVEVWRRDPARGIPWHADFYGLFRGDDDVTDEDGVATFTAKCPGQMSILGFRHVAYAAGVANRSTFSAVVAETIMKTLVTYNCTALAVATADPATRHRNGDLGAGMGMTITVEADQGRGNVLSRSFANGNLLSILSDTLAPGAGGDFSLEKTGAAEWTFRFHPGQLGTDKSTGADKVEFSQLRGNLLQPRLTHDRLNEATVAICGGQDTGTNRVYVIVEGPDYAANNDIEIWVNASNEATTAGLASRGAASLEGKRATVALAFDVLQTSQVFYSRVAVAGKKTYREGDLVAVVHRDIEAVRKVTAVEVSVSAPQEAGPVVVKVETEAV